MENFTEKLKGSQRKYLRGLAHGMKPVIYIGQKGITDSVANALEEALDVHELVKLKFIDFKEKVQKKEFIDVIEKKNRCEMVGMIGHTAIFYRRHRDPEKRKIFIPER
ncbi:MAG: YhbY family RNA-binding protein [Desulfobacterales bacterium]